MHSWDWSIDYVSRIYCSLQVLQELEKRYSCSCQNSFMSQLFHVALFLSCMITLAQTDKQK
jgi:hypothetical protein